MTLAGVSLAYLKDRWATNLLNALLLALGVATIALLLHLAHAVEKRLARDAEGIDLVVGAKGSPLQLILSSIFHADVPTGNIPLAEAQKVSSNPLVRSAIPLALGDSFRRFRIVGTNADYVALYDGKTAQGRLWNAPFEAVLGAEVAAGIGMAMGDKFIGTHGLGDGGHAHEENAYSVVGILEPTGTVLDRLILTSVESVILAHTQHMDEAGDHAHEHGEKVADDHDHDHGHEHEHEHEHAEEAPGLETPKRDLTQEITALLVQYRSPLAAIRLPAQINQTTALQAAVPAIETTRLLSIIGVGLDALRGFAGVLLVSAGLGIFVALLTAMNQRSGDIAILRTMGATRGRVFALVIAEGTALALAGGLFGLLLAHVALALAGSSVPDLAALRLTGFDFLPGELLLIAAVVATGALAAAIPAWRAYRIDIITTLNRSG